MKRRYIVTRPDREPTKPHVLWMAIRKVRQYESRFEGPWTLSAPGKPRSRARSLNKTLGRLRYLLERGSVDDVFRVRHEGEQRATKVRIVDMAPSYPTPRTPDCYPDEELGLVVKEFHFIGKGRDVTIKVKLIPQAMEALERAMDRCGTIQVTQSFTSAYSGSYRNCTQQAWLRMKYEAGEGHLAAKPGESYHQTGRALDLYLVSDAERAAMKAEGFFDLLPADPPHFTWGARG